MWVTPAWLDIDLLLLDLQRDYEATLCPGCGDPLESHAGKTYKDYGSAAVVCPAVIALDRAQVAQAKRDGNKDAKPDPARPRTWVHGTRAQMADYSAWVKQLLKGGSHG